jgi:DNA-binding NarL/FixJ family response regulator
MKTIVIADPAPLILEGIQHILSSLPDIQIKGTFLSLSSLKSGMNLLAPDLLIFDGEMAASTDKKSNIDTPWKCWPETKIVLFHTETNPCVIRRYLTGGVQSYLLKCVEPPELLLAVKLVLQNKVYVQESVRQAVLEQSLGLCGRKTTNKHLTKREIQVIELIVEEYTTQEIAEKLFVSFNTVESHRKNVISKLGVKNAAGIVREALRLRLYPNFNL